MAELKDLVAYVDVDDTLVRSFGSTRIRHLRSGAGWCTSIPAKRRRRRSRSMPMLCTGTLANAALQADEHLPRYARLPARR